jgi:hypothetical protein
MTSLNAVHAPFYVDFDSLPQLRKDRLEKRSADNEPIDDRVPRALRAMGKAKRDEKNPYIAVVRSHVGKALASRISEREYGTMTNSEVVSARMTKVSYINLREGPHAAQAFTTEHLKNWKLDLEITDEHGAVFQHQKTGEVRIAYRGTQTGADWKTNLRLATGLTDSGSQFKALESQMQLVKGKYGKLPEMLSGHSKGGGQALVMGERHGIATHTQDPFIPVKELFGGQSNAEHSIVRTPTDWVSGGSNLVKLRPGFTQIDIQASAGTSVLESHDLNLMTRVNHEGTGNTTFDPAAKNTAFVAKEIKNKILFGEVASKVGYKPGTDEYVTLRAEYKSIARQPPATIQQHLDNAGYVPKAKASVSSIAAARVGGALSSVIGESVVKVVNLKTASAILVGAGAVGALHALGVEDELTVAGVSGGVGNVAVDAVGSATRALGRGAVAETAIAGEISLLGAGVRSITRGGVSGVLGFGVERAVSAIGGAIGIDDTATRITAAAAGGAAAGAIFGPEGALIGALFSAGIEGATAMWQATTPHHDYMLGPFRHQQIDEIIGADAAVRGIVSEFNRKADFSNDAISKTEEQISARVIAMQQASGWTHGYGEYKAELQAKTRGSQEAARDGRGRPTVMLGGDYSSIQATERKQARAQQDFYEKFGPHLDRQESSKTSESMDKFLDGIISKDPKFMHAANVREANSRIRQIVEELAPGNITGDSRSGHGPSRDAADIKALGRFSLPQLNEDGSISMQQWKTDSVTSIPPMAVPEIRPMEIHEEIHVVLSAS